MLGSPCNPCCDQCGGNKPYVAPANTGAWVPSGSWDDVGGATWTLNESIASDAWFFYGSEGTSKLGGGAVLNEQRAWDNPCNWYSVKTTSPSDTLNLPNTLIARATGLPPSNATIHVYSYLNLKANRTVQRAYFWDTILAGGFNLTTTHTAYGTTHGSVFSNSTTYGVSVYGGALFRNGALNGANVYNGATFTGAANAGGGQLTLAGPKYDSFVVDYQEVGQPVTTLMEDFLNGIVYDGAVFNNNSRNGSFFQIEKSSLETGVSGTGIVFGGAVFSTSSYNNSFVNGGAVFNSGSVNNGSPHILAFGPSVIAFKYSATVNGGAIFNAGENWGVVNGGAVFNGASTNRFGVVNGGATFNGTSRNRYQDRFPDPPFVSKVAGGATFNDDACTEWSFGGDFVVDVIGLPTCNGTATSLGPTCGCG